MKENCDFSRQSHSFFKRHEQQWTTTTTIIIRLPHTLLKTTENSEMSEGCRTLKEKENNKYKKYNGCRVHFSNDMNNNERLKQHFLSIRTQ